MIFTYTTEEHGGVQYLTEARLTSTKGEPDYVLEFPEGFREHLRTDEGDLAWMMVEHPDYDPDLPPGKGNQRYIFVYSPLEPEAAVLDERARRHVTETFMQRYTLVDVVEAIADTEKRAKMLDYLYELRSTKA